LQARNQPLKPNIRSTPPNEKERANSQQKPPAIAIAKEPTPRHTQRNRHSGVRINPFFQIATTRQRIQALKLDPGQRTGNNQEKPSAKQTDN